LARLSLHAGEIPCCALACAWACGSRAAIAPDSGVGEGDADAAFDARRSDAEDVIDAGPTILLPLIARPLEPPGQIVIDFGVPPGAPGSGWDFCIPGALTTCVQCVPPPDRTAFEVFYGVGAQDTDPSKAQVFAYFDPPRSIAQGTGLWFDLSFEGHKALGSTMTVVSVAGACQTKSVLGKFDLDHILQSPAVWNRACVKLPPSVLEGLGFRFDGGALTLLRQVWAREEGSPS